MKINRKFLIGITLIFMTLVSYSQIDTSQVLPKRSNTEKETGEGSWARFLRDNLNNDVGTDNGAPKGKYTVIIEFTIFEDGQLGDFKSITNYGFGMEEELIRVLKKSPKWRPAIQDGKFVKAKKRQPITFRIDD